jgi:hypothetical protein
MAMLFLLPMLTLVLFFFHLDKSVVEKKCMLHCVRGRDYHANTFCRRTCPRQSRIHWSVEVGCREESSLRRYAEGRKNTKNVATPTFPISKVLNLVGQQVTTSVGPTTHSGVLPMA